MSKKACIGCKIEFTLKTLKKNDGLCGKCVTKIKGKKETKRKSKKETIPKIVKTKTWNKYIGRDIGTSKCYCCKTNEITQSHFESGHVKSEHNGGKVNIDNLRPICSECNKSMGTKNMIEFMDMYGFNDKTDDVINNSKKTIIKVVPKLSDDQKRKLIFNNSIRGGLGGSVTDDRINSIIYDDKSWNKWYDLHKSNPDQTIILDKTLGSKIVDVMHVKQNIRHILADNYYPRTSFEFKNNLFSASVENKSFDS